MLSMRTFARAVPRCTARLSTKAVRSPLRAAALSASRQNFLVRPAAAFSSISARRQGETDQQLAASLGREIAYEQEQPDEYPQDVQEYLDNTSFELHETLGKEEVKLTRKFDEENITVTFSIADIRNFEQTEELDEDPALFDEEDNVDDVVNSSQSGGANTKGAINQGRTPNGNIRVAPEDDVAPADRPELAEDGFEDEGSQDYPVNVSVNIAKQGKGVLEVQLVASAGEFEIAEVAWFPSLDLAEAKTAEKQVEAAQLYRGAQFQTLDEDLRDTFYRYVEERGINTALATFIPNFIDYKEQREYLNWLQNVKKFVE